MKQRRRENFPHIGNDHDCAISVLQGKFVNARRRERNGGEKPRAFVIHQHQGRNSVDPAPCDLEQEQRRTRPAVAEYLHQRLGAAQSRGKARPRRNCSGRDRGWLSGHGYFTSRLTSLPGTMITLTICFPAVKLFTFSLAIAASRNASCSMSTGTRMTARSLPL